MATLEVCQWLNRTPLSLALRGSKWGFAVVEMFHLAALAVFGGTVLVGTLRTAGIFLPAPVPSIIEEQGRVFAWALLALFLSGSLLFLESPLRYYANPAFRVKLVLLGIGISVSAALAVARRETDVSRQHRALSVLVFFAALVWFSTAIAGRVIGVL